MILFYELLNYTIVYCHSRLIDLSVDFALTNGLIPSGLGTVLSHFTASSSRCCCSKDDCGCEQVIEEEYEREQSSTNQNVEDSFRAINNSGSIDVDNSNFCEKENKANKNRGESNFDGQDCNNTTISCLSPLQEIHELRENESSTSNSSSPKHITSRSLVDLQEECNRCSNEGFNLIMYDNLDGNANSNAITQQTIRNNQNIGADLDNQNYNNLNNVSSNLNDNGNFHQNENQQDDDLDNGNSCNNYDVMGSTTSRNTTRSSVSPATRLIMTIGDKMNLLDYSEREWHGNTAKANIIRQGYSAIESQIGLSKLRCIRGDNYCAVRATVFQALVSGHTLPRSAPKLARLVAEVASGASWLDSWTFGNRLSYGNVLDGARDCLEAMDNVFDGLIGVTDRESTLVDLLNNCHRLDTQLCEAIKLHMLVAALQLHEANMVGSNVPLFAMIMFARESSDTPAAFISNHLNVVGDSAGLEQIEMFLLGHSIRATLQVVRPSCHGNDDYICYYPDTNIEAWTRLTLIAEDDRHYNVLVE